MNRSVARIEDPAVDGMRVDRYISEVLGLCSRSQLKHRVLDIRVNGLTAKPSHHVSVGEVIDVLVSDPERHDIRPEKIELDVVFENDDVVVLNKPQGLVVHPAAGNFAGTLVQGLAYRYGSIGGDLGESNVRPGIVHRLDKDTSGVLIAAKNVEAQEFLSRQFRGKSAEKVYLAICKGAFVELTGTIRSYIRRDPTNRKRFTASEESGKLSITHFRVLRQRNGYAFLALRPATGRTHQLRVHLASIGHPILGDPIYSRPDGKFPDATLMLHAHRLAVRVPNGTAEGVTMLFRAPLPGRFKSVLRLLSAAR